MVIVVLIGGPDDQPTHLPRSGDAFEFAAKRSGGTEATAGWQTRDRRDEASTPGKLQRFRSPDCFAWP
jgi:hypothetical protein